VPDPNSEHLAEMAYITAKTHKSVFNVEPIVAMLSFSTKGSGNHPFVDKVRKAVEIAKEKYPDLKCLMANYKLMLQLLMQLEKESSRK